MDSLPPPPPHKNFNFSFFPKQTLARVHEADGPAQSVRVRVVDHQGAGAVDVSHVRGLEAREDVRVVLPHSVVADDHPEGPLLIELVDAQKLQEESRVRSRL